MGFGDVFSKLFKKEKEAKDVKKEVRREVPPAEGDEEAFPTEEGEEFSEFVGEDEELLPPFFKEDLYTETMADIYMNQGLYEEAVKIYEKIIKQDPQNDSLRKKMDKAKTYVLSKKAGRLAD
ncbi:MAG TPA: tetratricopeptide repeat protein [Thermodesulfobacteriota bacterium]|nr:tetratricopeptide repeat protein [Thermodesulfobacteriota bacterium]